MNPSILKNIDEGSVERLKRENDPLTQKGAEGPKGPKGVPISSEEVLF